MAVITEIAAETHGISVYVPEIDMQFNHFLVRDEQPLLSHRDEASILNSGRDN